MRAHAYRSENSVCLSPQQNICLYWKSIKLMCLSPCPSPPGSLCRPRAQASGRCGREHPAAAPRLSLDGPARSGGPQRAQVLVWARPASVPSQGNENSRHTMPSFRQMRFASVPPQRPPRGAGRAQTPAPAHACHRRRAHARTACCWRCGAAPCDPRRPPPPRPPPPARRGWCVWRDRPGETRRDSE